MGETTMTIFQEGDQVTYQNGHKFEKGIIKTIEEGRIFVVYNCGGEWENYRNYTAALTPVKFLFKGWLTPSEQKQ